jgi:5-(carboxyamino)imidazole ribonucleotide mutase
LRTRKPTSTQQKKATQRPRRAKPQEKPLVGVVMGSDTDLKWMEDARLALKKFGIPFETKVISAHRTPVAMTSYAAMAQSRGLAVIIAGAGGAAHLPGMLAANTTLPVIGVPCPVGAMQGEDAMWSVVQMPKGVPVATVAIGNGWNAGVLAAQILALSTSEIATKICQELRAYKLEMEQIVGKMNEQLPRS